MLCRTVLECVTVIESVCFRVARFISETVVISIVYRGGESTNKIKSIHGLKIPEMSLNKTVAELTRLLVIMTPIKVWGVSAKLFLPVINLLNSIKFTINLQPHLHVLWRNQKQDFKRLQKKLSLFLGLEPPTQNKHTVHFQMETNKS